MFISEFIVGLWFIPVVLFVVIPLSVLCAWSIHQLLRKVGDKIEEAVRDESRVPNLRTRPAV